MSRVIVRRNPSSQIISHTGYGLDDFWGRCSLPTLIEPHIYSRDEERTKQRVAHQPLIMKVIYRHLFYWCLCVHCGVIHANLWDNVLLSEEWQRRITFLPQNSKILRKPYFHKHLNMTSKWPWVSLHEQRNMVSAVHTHKWKWTHTGIKKLLHQFLPTWTIIGFRSLSIFLLLVLGILNVYSSKSLRNKYTLCSSTSEANLRFLFKLSCWAAEVLPSALPSAQVIGWSASQFLRARASPGCQQETAFCTPGQGALLLSWGRTGNRCLFAFLLQWPILSWLRKICEDDMA